MRSRLPVALSLFAALLAIVAPASRAAASSPGLSATRLYLGLPVFSVAADPSRGILYAGTGAVTGSVVAISGSTGKIKATISVPSEAHLVAVDPAADKLYVIDGHVVYIINAATGKLTATINLPSALNVFGVAADPITHMLYLAGLAYPSVEVINGTTDKVTAISLTDPVLDPHPSPGDVAVDAATNRIYVSDLSAHAVAVIDGTTSTVTDRIPLPANARAFGAAFDSGTLYLADYGSGAIYAVDPATRTVTTLLTGLTSPWAIAAGPGGTLYVTSPASRTNPGVTYLIDVASQKITAQIPRGGLSLAAVSGHAYPTDPLLKLRYSVNILSPSAVTSMCPVIVGPVGFTFTVGQAGQGQLMASAIPAATFSATGLPRGFTLSRAGLLSGDPAPGTGGAYSAAVTAANGISPADLEQLTILVDQPAVITSASHVTFQVGKFGTFTVTASGFPAATFTESGALPSAVQFGPDGQLAGLPIKGTQGRYKITLTASDGVGPPSTQKFTLTVGQPPSFVSPDRVTFRVGVHKTFTIVTHGFPAASITESGKLPSGISFRAGRHGTATLSGKALRRARGHTFKVTFTGRNGVGRAAHQVLTIVVR